MAEYIEKEELLRKRPFCVAGGLVNDYTEGFCDCVDEARETIKNMPAAGVAPVVRCQECIHWMAEGGAGYKSLGAYRCPCARWSNDDGYTAYTDPDDFCVYGEEKEEEQDDE